MHKYVIFKNFIFNSVRLNCDRKQFLQIISLFNYNNNQVLFKIVLIIELYKSPQKGIIIYI